MENAITTTWYGLLKVIIIITACYMLYSHLSAMFTSYRLGCKSPPMYPILNSLQLFLGVRKRLQRHTVMPGHPQLHKTYGLTFQRLGFFRNTIYTLDPMNIRDVWATNFPEWGVETMRMQVLGPFCGRGIATVDGSLWERSRDAVRPHFYGTTAATIDLNVLQGYVDRYIGKLPRDVKVIDLQPLVYNVGFLSGYQFVLGESFDKLPGYENISIETIRNWLDYAVFGSRRRFVQGPLKYFKRDETRKWIEARTAMEKFTEAVLARAIHLQAEKGKWSPLSGEKTTLINRMIAEFKDPIEQRSLLLQYFMGSSFTVSSTVTTACYLLSKHPKAWSRLREEILAHQDAGFTVDTLKELPYLRKVIDESLRLFPLTTIEFRTAARNVILPSGGGIDGLSPIYAPKGTTLVTSIFSLHRQEVVFGENVDEFNPDRWDTHEPRRWEYMPFGGGPRKCIGQDKGRADSSYILARLAQQIETMTSLEGGQDTRIGQDMPGCKVEVKWAAGGVIS